MREFVVSVIIPVYNVEDYLDECAQSVLDQSYRSLDVILIDDGSIDGSGTICDEIARRDDRVRVVHQSNGGLSHARNVGLELASGDLITFLDSDDWLHPEMVKTLVGEMATANADVAVCNFERVHDSRSPSTVGSSTITILEHSEVPSECIGPRHTLLTVACAKVFKASLFEEVRFPVGRLHEDEFTTYKALYAARRVLLLDEVLYYYRQRRDSITGSDFSTRRGLDIIAAYAERAEFLAFGGHPVESESADMQTFLKYVQLHQWLGRNDPALRKRLLAEMRELLDSIRSKRLPGRFKVFSQLYLWMPIVGAGLYRMRARVHGLRIPQ